MCIRLGQRGGTLGQPGLQGRALLTQFSLGLAALGDFLREPIGTGGNFGQLLFELLATGCFLGQL